MLSEEVNHFEQVFFSWLAFVVITNVYASLSLVMVGLYQEAMSSYRLMNEFPEYSGMYRSNFIFYAVLAVTYPI